MKPKQKHQKDDRWKWESQSNDVELEKGGTWPLGRERDREDWLLQGPKTVEVHKEKH